MDADREQPGSHGMVEEIGLGVDAGIVHGPGDERRVQHRYPTQDPGLTAPGSGLGCQRHDRLSVKFSVSCCGSQKRMTARLTFTQLGGLGLRGTATTAARRARTRGFAAPAFAGCAYVSNELEPL